MGVMKVICPKGDAPITWELDKPETVTMAKEAFDRMVGGEHYIAFRQNLEQRDDAPLITEFDPEAEVIIMVRQMMGG